jgi:hypothetical protein
MTGLASTLFITAALAIGPSPHSKPEWANLLSTPEVVVNYHIASLAHEGHSVKAWVQIYLASPVSDKKNLIRYDSVKAAYRFDCSLHQQLLIQGTYNLGQVRVYERFPSDSPVEELGPGKIADSMRKRFCNEIGDADIL